MGVFVPLLVGVSFPKPNTLSRLLFLVSSERYIVVVQFITAETISYIEVVSLLKNNEYIV